MRHALRPVPLLLALCVALAAQAAPPAKPIPGPPRALTDPRSLVSPTLADAAPLSIADLHFIRQSADAAWSADGKSVIVSTNLTGRLNLWQVPVDGGFPQQLVQSDDAQYGIAVSPDGQWIVYHSDRAGAEIHDLYALPARGGSAINLTASDDASEVAPVFSRDGRTLAFSRRDKRAPSNNIVVLDMATRQMRQLTHEASPDAGWSTVAFAPDGKSLIANRGKVDQSAASVWRIDIASGNATALTPADEEHFNAASDLSSDGRWLAVTTQTADGDQRAALMDLADRRIQPLLDDPWEQHAGHFSPDGKTVLITRNVNGRDGVMAVDVATRKARELPLPAGMNSDEGGRLPAYSPDGKTLLTVHESGNTPADFWLLDAGSGKRRQLTRMGLASLSPARMPATHIVNYPGADGTVISAVLWMPFNLKRDGSAPAVVYPHGGPTWQLKDRFDATPLALASRGYLVIAPNPRGSTGFGRAFREGNRMDLGGGDLQDIVAATRFLVDTGYVDGTRIGITGGSYGGYMTLMALGRTPEVFAAGVQHYGIVNWYTMWENGSPALRYYQKSLIGDPVADKAVYDAASPMTYLHQTRAPLLTLQGDNDLRVPKEQAVQVVKMLRDAGKVADAHYYPDEGHGFQKRENQMDAVTRTVDWFERYLKPAK